MKEIVIKLHDEEYEEIVNDEACGLHTLTRAVANGKVLPKGHGELKDVSKIINDGISKGFCDWYDEIKYAETLVEADKGDE